MRRQRHPERVLDIFQTRNTKKRLIVDVGSTVFRVSNSNPACYAVDRIADVRVGDRTSSDYVDGNISDFNRGPCDPGQRVI